MRSTAHFTQGLADHRDWRLDRGVVDVRVEDLNEIGVERRIPADNHLMSWLPLGDEMAAHDVPPLVLLHRRWPDRLGPWARQAAPS